MIGNVFCNDNQDRIEHQRQRLGLAKERMVEFPTLSSIFNKFENYKTILNNGEDIPSNVVFNLVSSNNYHNTYTKSNLIQSAGTWNVIKDLEDAVNLFFISNPEPKMNI